MTISTGSFWHFSDFHLDPVTPPGAATISGLIEGIDLSRFRVPALPTVFNYIDEVREKQGGGKLTNALVITGDLVAKGNWSDPALVRDLIERLRTALGLERKEVFIVPGNHDLTWRNEKIPSVKMREAFDEATFGYVTPRAACEVHQLGDLAFVLLDTTSLAGAASGVKRALNVLKGVLPPFVRGPLWRPLQSRLEEVLREDVASAPTDDLLAALESVVVDGKLPPDKLGILLAHHPFVSHPFGEVDVRPFAVAIGAGQAKRLLARIGISVCFYGHQHSHLLLIEHTSGVAEEFRFNHVGCASITPLPEAGFNILRYAFTPETGEGALTVEPIAVLSTGFLPGPTRRIYVPPRSGQPAHTIRMSERININGDARTDVWFTDLSVKGWKEENGVPAHDMLFDWEVVGGQLPERPELNTISANTTAVFERTHPSPPAGGAGAPSRIDRRDLENLGKLKGCIRIFGPGEKGHVSLAYRVHANHSYAVSFGDRVRTDAPPYGFPGIKVDEEGLVHVVREPTERLEIFVRTAYDAPKWGEISVRTFEETSAGKLEPNYALGKFSAMSVESWPEGKRIRVIVEHPLQGVGYAVVWPLPEEQPGATYLLGQAANLKDAIGPATREAERVRAALITLRSEVEAAHPVKLICDNLLVRLREIVELSPSTVDYEDLEIAVFVRDTPLMTPQEFRDAFSNRVAVTRPYLEVISSSFPRTDSRWGVRIPAGLGVAGRAYATSFPIAYDAAAIKDRERAGHMMPSLSPYLLLDADKSLPSHNMLYAIPLAHWEVKAVVIGCICIGTRGELIEGSRLALDGIEKTTEKRPVELAAEAGSAFLQTVFKAVM